MDVSWDRTWRLVGVLSGVPAPAEDGLCSAVPTPTSTFLLQFCSRMLRLSLLILIRI